MWDSVYMLGEVGLGLELTGKLGSAWVLVHGMGFVWGLVGELCREGWWWIYCPPCLSTPTPNQTPLMLDQP